MDGAGLRRVSEERESWGLLGAKTQPQMPNPRPLLMRLDVAGKMRMKAGYFSI